MKKKPARLSRKYRKKAQEDPTPVAPVEQKRYLLPQRNGPPLGVELLWAPETVDLYIEVLKRSTNPITLEASAGAIHNLLACSWNVSYPECLLLQTTNGITIHVEEDQLNIFYK